VHSLHGFPRTAASPPPVMLAGLRAIRCGLPPVTRITTVTALSSSSLNQRIVPRRHSSSIQNQDKAASDKALEVNREIIEEHAKNSDTIEVFGSTSVKYSDDDYNMAHPIWANEYIYRVKTTHKQPKGIVDTLALATVTAMRFNFDWMSGWMFGTPNTTKALRRVVFLETVAGVPGSIAGILRHLASLRRMRRDNGWIHTLFEEAENERMHLLTYLELKKPTKLFRTVVWITQGIFYNFFFLAYLVSPRFCHRIVGYLEEQAVITYTHILHLIDHDVGDLGTWKTAPAPGIAVSYWKLPKDATLRDVVAVTRADESHHRDVNHAFASMQPTDPNPFKPGF